MKTLIKLAILTILILNRINLSALTIEVQGIISHNTILIADTIKVFGDITIEEGATLTIAPGAYVEFQGEYGIIAHGILSAVGTKNDTITFTVRDTTGFSQNNHTGWKGIDFLTLNSNDTSKLVYCKLMYGKCVGYPSYYGGAIKVASETEVIVSNCLLMNNYASCGGAIYIYMPDYVLLKNNKIIFNKALQGGGIYITGRSSLILNNLICNNNAEQAGGGIYFGYVSSSDSILFVNNTVSTNNASSGGGFYFDGSGRTVFVNNIIWNNNSETNKEQLYLRQYIIKPAFYNNNIEGGKNRFAGEVYPFLIYEDNINADPRFTNTSDYRLSDSSFCINTGKSNFSALELVNSDLSDNPRIYDGIVDEIDMGAYEYQGDPVNRRPLLVKSGNQNTLISTAKHMTVDYFDADIGDTHTITVSSDNINITVNNLSGDTAGSTYDLIPADEWSGNALITVKVADNQGYYDSETYELMVSDSVRGFIKENTCWSQDTIIVKGDIYVDNGVTLTVNPGTVILFCGNYKIDVYGRLLAVGTSENNITFTVSDTAGYHNNCFTGWQGIKFMNTQPDNDTSKLIHCIIQFIKNESAYGSIAISHFSKILISKCHIKNNISLSSALIEIYRAHPAITGNFITENRFTEGGKIFDISYCNPRLINNLICNNDCRSVVITLETSDAELINNTICCNKVHAIITGTSSNPSFINTIFWGNYSDNSLHLFSFYKTTCNAIFESCLMPEELYPVGNYTSMYKVYMNNIIFLDPNFSDAESMDYSLTDSSYCINTGTADTTGLNLPHDDIAGNPRIYEGINMRIDIGAYEFQGTPNKKPVLEKTPDQYTLVSTPKLMKISYIDDDIDTIYILSDNMNVTPANLTGDTTGSKYELIPADGWEGEANIMVQIKDVVGNTDSDTFKLYVSKYYCGPITENMIWDIDTVKVCCDVTVAGGATLTIAPGTTIEFLDNYSMEVQGRIIATGTCNEPITFTVADTTGFYNNEHCGWGGIRFYYPSALEDTSKLVHCIMEYSKTPPIDVRGFNKLLISGCDIRNNVASGIYIKGSDAIIKNSIIHDNQTDEEGGGIYLIMGSNPLLVNNLIFNNRGDLGGGLSVVSASFYSINNTICNNHARVGGGIYLNAIWQNSSVKNTIIRGNIANNSGQQIYMGSSSNETEFHYCNIEGGKDSIRGEGSGAGLIYANNIDAVPYFTDEENNDFRLSDSSICINAGDPLTDISGFLSDFAGNPRIMDDTIDIGAYEFPLNTAPSDILLSEKQIDENVLPGSVVGQFSTVDANKADTHTYSFDTGDGTNDADNNNFTISGDSLLTYLCPDYEVKDTFRIYVKTTDNGFYNLNYSKAFVLVIKDVNEQPIIESQSFSVDENSSAGTIIGTINASDVDAGQSLTYSIISGNTDNAYSVNPLTGEITVNNSDALDYEIIPSFELTISVQDDGQGNLTDEAFITVTMNDVNEQPFIEPQSFAIDENSQAGAIVGTVTASDVDAGQALTYSIISGNTDNAFTVDPLTGEITVNNSSALDYETTPSFGLTINVQDNGPGNLVDEALITVNINNIDEPVSIIDFDSHILRIYPNPVKAELYIEFSDENLDELLIELRSVNGTIYYQSETKVSDTDRIIELELSDFPEGLYILNVKSATIFITGKIEIIGIR